MNTTKQARRARLHRTAKHNAKLHKARVRHAARAAHLREIARLADTTVTTEV